MTEHTFTPYAAPSRCRALHLRGTGQPASHGIVTPPSRGEKTLRPHKNLSTPLYKDRQA